LDESLQSNTLLPHIVRALNSECPRFGLKNSRQQKRGENCNDSEDDQQFNQGEG
jgi:hypothetical protein